MSNTISNISSNIPTYSSNDPKVTDISHHIFFVYIKNYCHYSKDACKKIQLLQDSKLTIFDVETNQYCDYKNDSFVNFRQETHLHFQAPTVPQIYVQIQQKWSYIGGDDDINNILNLHF